MIVEKIDYIKTGNFSQSSNSEMVSELKFRAYYLSKLKHIAPDRLMEALRKEVQLDLVEEDYEAHLPEDLKTLISEVSYRIFGRMGEGIASKYQDFSHRKLYRLLLTFMAELFYSITTRVKEQNLFLVFYRGNLRSLIDEIYLRYSGVDVQGFKRAILRTKNNFISYKRLLAQLEGKRLMKIVEDLDYDVMTDEQAKNMCDKIEKTLQAIPEWYRNRSEQLKVLCLDFGVKY